MSGQVLDRPPKYPGSEDNSNGMGEVRKTGEGNRAEVKIGAGKPEYTFD